MSRFSVRASKVKHVFGEQWKGEKSFIDLRVSTTTGDHNYIKANNKFWAVPVRGGGGAVMVRPMEATGKIAPDYPVIAGHTGAVFDFDFNPFNENMLATGSDDSTCKVWAIPDGGLTELMTAPIVDLRGHRKPVTFVHFHPCANNVLSTASKDKTVKLWDIEKAADKVTIDGLEGFVQDIKWNADGSVLGVSTKDKKFTLYDPRSKAIIQQGVPHDGPKCFKVAFLEGTSRVVTVGFTRAAKRQMKIWDVSDLSTPLASLDIDQSAGVMMPFYDADTKLLYLAGKGDGNIRYYEMVDSAPWFYNIDEFRSGVSQKGIAMCPKRGYNVPRCEIARFLKLTSKGTVDPVSFIVPRKSECFQDDIYPDAISGEPALSADAWFGGENKPAKRMSMDPAARGASGGEGKPAAFKFTPMKPAIEIQKELDTANARIAELEAEIAALKLEA